MIFPLKSLWETPLLSPLPQMMKGVNSLKHLITTRPKC